MGTGSSSVTAPLAKERGAAYTLNKFLGKYFYLLMALVMFGLVARAFSRTVDHGLLHATPARPLLLWIHGAAFSTWMIFFALQSGFVRVHKVSVHRIAGWFGSALAGAMVVLGVAVALVMTRFDTDVLGQKGAETFLSILFCDMIVFGTCVSAAIVYRRQPEFHRRLMFVATCELMNAAFGRFDFIAEHYLFYPMVDMFVIFGIARDRLVDGRVHRVYLRALISMMLLQALAVYAWRGNPEWWQKMTRAIMSW